MTRQQKMMLFTLFLGVLAVLYLAVILRKADASYSCEYEEPIDVCSNLEGNQAVVPDGYLTDGDYCYVPEVPKEEPTPGLPGNPPTFAGSSTDAPGVCSASIPNAPANPLVWRKGGSAIVQWLPDGTANQARIYWRINGQATWMYSLTTYNSGYVVINDLGANDVTFGVAQFNGCNESRIVTIVDANTEGWVLYQP